MSDEQKPQDAPQQPQFAQVDVRFLQSILDYMKKRPYDEVYQFIEVLTGRQSSVQANRPAPDYQESDIDPRVTEVKPKPKQ